MQAGRGTHAVSPPGHQQGQRQRQQHRGARRPGVGGAIDALRSPASDSSMEHSSDEGGEGADGEEEDEDEEDDPLARRLERGGGGGGGLRLDSHRRRRSGDGGSSGNGALGWAVSDEEEEEGAGEGSKEGEGEDEEGAGNDDVCAVCGDGGELLLCDGCDGAAHLSCVGLAAVPRGDWFCAHCCAGAGAEGDHAMRLDTTQQLNGWDGGRGSICR